MFGEVHAEDRDSWEFGVRCSERGFTQRTEIVGSSVFGERFTQGTHIGGSSELGEVPKRHGEYRVARRKIHRRRVPNVFLSLFSSYKLNSMWFLSPLFLAEARKVLRRGSLSDCFTISAEVNGL